MEQLLKFPNDFLWGAATSAYQVEGEIENADWSKFYPAGKSCDHYHSYEKDFNLLKELNLNAYRFSIEWSRIEPREGEFDKKEIEHYREVLFSLRKRGIKSMVTLHHFTIPLWLAKIGGWVNPKVVFYFLRFAKKVFAEYQDLVNFWITINEPLIYGVQAYLKKRWPPQKNCFFLFLKVMRNQIKAHREIYNNFHQMKQGVKIGIAKDNVFFEPFSPKSPLDKLSSYFANYFWNDFFLNRIKNHLDFIGLNYYFHDRIKFPFLKKNENKIVSDLGWEIYPEGIYYVLKDLEKYRKPIFITENGVADAKDILRKEFIKGHLYQIHKAIEEGIDVKGYFYWSLMDNLEWDLGFSPRFGLVKIDYNTLKREIRKSAFYYAQICKTNSLICG